MSLERLRVGLKRQVRSVSYTHLLIVYWDLKSISYYLADKSHSDRWIRLACNFVKVEFSESVGRVVTLYNVRQVSSLFDFRVLIFRTYGWTFPLRHFCNLSHITPAPAPEQYRQQQFLFLWDQLRHCLLYTSRCV